MASPIVVKPKEDGDNHGDPVQISFCKRRPAQGAGLHAAPAEEITHSTLAGVEEDQEYETD